MPTNKLGGRVNNYISAILEGLHQVRGRQRIIEHKWKAVFMRNVSYVPYIQGRIHNAGVDVAKLLEPKEIRGMFGAIKDIRRCLVDWNRTSVCRAVRRFLPRVQR